MIALKRVGGVYSYNFHPEKLSRAKIMNFSYIYASRLKKERLILKKISPTHSSQLGRE